MFQLFSIINRYNTSYGIDHNGPIICFEQNLMTILFTIDIHLAKAHNSTLK